MLDPLPPPPRIPRDEMLDPPPAYAAASGPVQAVEPVHVAVGRDFVRRDEKYGGSGGGASAAQA